ncbi:MAG: Clp protease ClpS [Lentimicrobiaceae bacterium]|jgi:ATP-dependent Clp protease adaptor protein ClpS|nr:Clp protease ClpS [Lentimicrobiaceae bacterium]MDG1901253.1 ATP-dependent Clp protease adaptor ClpS [Bacteroidales bacterium]MDG2080586.1 ATP-dependent Clp protease adaptor ClpS [Bacteroidales bacterium]|tara:strand:- start:4525 stop:4800 length:276 start_codon:yes stop_codon:yes gene_type:complete
MGTKEKTSVTPEVVEKEADLKNLILYNDDYNTFDFIIDSLVEVCGHDHNQAENCAIIAHHKGKCHIKKGNMDVIRPIYVEMTNRQITVEIV